MSGNPLDAFRNVAYNTAQHKQKRRQGRVRFKAIFRESGKSGVNLIKAQ